MKTFFFLLVLSTCAFSAAGQRTLEQNLYDGKIPQEVAGPNQEKVEVRPNGAVMITEVRQPTLTYYLPAKGNENGTAVIICPGGGYAKLSFSHEGADVAQKLAEQGITAVVLRYRLPDPITSTEPSLAPLQDAQQALYQVRKKAEDLKLEKIGLMGFSAGGHLAATAGTYVGQPTIPNPEKFSLRPDFMVLVYPVISSDSTLWHRGSFQLLLGKNPSAQALAQFSADRQVTAQTPPTFLLHAADDRSVPAQNSLLFYQTLQQFKVPSELHIYQRGGHGFGLYNETTRDFWLERCVHWMKSNGW